MYHKIITEKKNRLNNSSNKENVLEIKQNLFQELTTQSSQKNKYKDNDDYNNKYINFLKSRTNEENTFPDSDIIYENNFIKKYSNINKQRNKNNYKPQSKNKRNKTLTVIKSINNFNNKEDDLMYIITKSPNKMNDQIQKNKNKNDNIISHIALPFCHYHKFNLKLPKKYTCNFKNCSCCKFKTININNEKNEIYPCYNYPYPSERSKKKFNNVLDKFIRKYKNNKMDKKNFININIHKKPKKLEHIPSNKKLKKLKKKNDILKLEENKNKNYNDNENKNILINSKKYYNNDDNINNENDDNNKNILLNLKKYNNNEKDKDSKNNNDDNSKSFESKSDKMSDIDFNFQKPDNNDLKISQKKYEIKNESEEEKNGSNSLSVSDEMSLDIPEEMKIDDDNYLFKYIKLVNERKRKSKIHFSVKYYQKLNKSYKIYANDNKKESPFKDRKKQKNFEFLRES